MGLPMGGEALPMRDITEDLRDRLAAIQVAFNVATSDHEDRVMALQTDYRRKTMALERERQTVLELLKIEEARFLPSEQPGISKAKQPPLPLAEFIITKLHANGPMTKEQIRAEIDRAGYLDGEVTGRTFHLTLMNISGAGGRISRLPDQRYAAPTAFETTLFASSLTGESPMQN
jgi:hypothetical protein